MAYRLRICESLPEGVRRIAREQVDKALEELSDEDRPKAVHQCRKRFKKIRGLIRLVRPALGQTYQDENQWYRNEARTLSRARDAEALLETLRSLRAERGDSADDSMFEAALNDLQAHQKQVMDDQGSLGRRIEQLADRLTDARNRIAGWELADDGFDAIGPGLGKTYRRARRSMKRALNRPTNERLHEWRKRSKYHWYHMRLLRNLWKPVFSTRADELSRLADLLGDDHDLAEFRNLLLKDQAVVQDPERLERLLGLAQIQRQHLQQKARKLGKLLFAEKTAAFVERTGAYLQVSDC